MFALELFNLPITFEKDELFYALIISIWIMVFKVFLNLIPYNLRTNIHSSVK